MNDPFLQFLEAPGAGTYRAIRQQVVSSEAYDPYSDELADFEELLESGQHTALRERISSSMPNLLLSPRAHLVLARLDELDGDEDSARMEHAIAAACVEGILATGDGSQASPYLVVRTSDEHDVVSGLRKELVRQTLTHREDRYFDILSCDDGSELWFDITDAYRTLGDPDS